MHDEVLFADNLCALPNVRHAFFTRSWGNLYFSETQAGKEASFARERAASYLGVSASRFLCCRQIHSPIVVTVGNVWGCNNPPEADGMVTDKSGIALGILTADCVPVLLAASNVPVIGAAHAGWRGALGGVLENTLEAMEKLGAERKRIQAAIGPCIAQKSYEVGPDFLASFLGETKANGRFFAPSIKKSRYQFDICGYVEAKLRDQGTGAVEVSSADTCANPDLFFSYRYSTLRGEKREGNLISALALN